MMRKAPNVNALWCSVLAEELCRLGVTTVGVAPGSRSTPLALAVAAHPGLSVQVHWDERALGFYALGYARATGRPMAVITTSGTAVANLAPAVAEAALDHVPLLLLSADRPPELRDTAANQTMDQTTLFGSFLRWRFDVPCPGAEVPLRMLLTTVDQAVARCQHGPAGPVHLNFMFREPLAPTPTKFPRRALLAPLQSWLRSSRPLTHVEVAAASGPTLWPEQSLQRGVIVAGALSVAEARAVLDLARRVQWPVLPDLQSGLRLGRLEPEVIAHADLVLGAEAWLARHRPEAVLVAGGRVTSKRLAALTASGVPTLRMTPHLERQDPAHALDVQWVGSLPHGLAELAAHIKPTPRPWLAAWQAAHQRAARSLRQAWTKRSSLSEPRVAWELSRRLPADHALVAGNSLPIRLLDTFSDPHGARPDIAANRGVSGIDGLLATAVGYAAGRGRPATLLIGDLSLLHDLNSLALLAGSCIPVVAVVLNNDGGGIFSFLPVAGTTPAFERVFGLPHGRTFEGAARMFDLAYTRVQSLPAFTRAYARACASGRSAVIEVTTTRRATVAVWRAVQQSAARAVDQG